MVIKPNFQFYNQVTPRYIGPLFMQLEIGDWYEKSELQEILQRNGINADGAYIVSRNIETWGLLKFGELKSSQGRRSSFRLETFGKQLQQTFSTNQELFFDLMHFLFYSAWIRSHNPKLGRFWVYSEACNKLWDNAPNPMDSYGLTSILQQESQNEFPEFTPKFPERAVRSVFPWLAALTPPFLLKKSTQREFLSSKRAYCSPQLFHLAIDLLYNQKQLKYGTSMAIGDEEIKSICRICLLDEGQFWEMADRTKMIIRGVDIRRGQFSTSIALEMKPQWIDLPDYTDEIEFDGFEGEEQ